MYFRLERLPTIVTVGGGYIASTIIAGILESGWSSELISVVEADPRRAEHLRRSYRVDTLKNIRDSNRHTDLVVWVLDRAIPRDTDAPDHFERALHVAIAPGLSRASLQKWMGPNELVRAAPNTAILAGGGVTALHGPKDLSEEKRRWAERIFSSKSSVVWADTDDEMEAINAVCVGGPAYVLDFLEGFEKAALEIGFDAHDARNLVLSVTEGVLLQARNSRLSFSDLKKDTALKSGTASIALKVLEKLHLQSSIETAVTAAFQLEREITKQNGAGEEWTKGDE